MRKAFTLVELLIVIAIIAILAAIAIPQFSKYKKRAYVAAMMSDAHNIIAAEEAYYAEHDNYTNPKNLPDLKLTKNVSFVDDGTGTKTCNGMPGYYFTLKHTNLGDSKYVVFDSCSDKAPKESSSPLSSNTDNSTSTDNSTTNSTTEG